MNENLNLVEILKDCPKGTKLYLTLWGEVKLKKVENDTYPIGVENSRGDRFLLTQDGKYIFSSDGECVLFPSKDQRDWSKFKPKFDPNTLKTFDKVLVRDSDSECWMIQVFLRIIEYEADYPYLCINYPYKYCIPYNDDTKHLVGTTEEAPEFYRYWEE